ncbi:MAG: hypothetical protein ACJ04Q_06735 [Flavobacteriales bacterium]
MVAGVVCIYRLYPFEYSKTQTIQNNLITVSGIFAGIVVAYLSAKLFQVREERENYQIKLNHLADKLTNYRKILYMVMKSWQFWVRYSDIASAKRKYPGISFTKLHSHEIDKYKEIRSFWLDEKDLSSTTVDLYMAMEEITGDVEGDVSWVYDRVYSYRYSLDYLQRISMPSNQIWYYLEGRYSKHTQGLINDKKIASRYNEVNQLPAEIDPKFKDLDFNRHLLASISTEFHEIYIPQLIELTELTQKGITKSMINLMVTLVVILVFGVMVPLLIQMLSIDEYCEQLLTFTMVVIVFVGLTNFIFDLFRLQNREIKLME